MNRKPKSSCGRQ